MIEKKLNRAYIRNIRNEFSRVAEFYASDEDDYIFNYSGNLSDDEPLLSIKHKTHSNDIYMQAYSSDLIDCEYVLAPGSRHNLDSTFAPLDKCTDIISDWFGNAIREVSAIEVELHQEKIKKIQQVIAPYLQSLVTEPSEVFSTQDVHDLKQRLDELESRFFEHKDAFELNQKNLDELKLVVENIKNLAETETQQGWLDKTLSKFGRWAGNIEKIDRTVKAIEKGIKLLEKGSDLIDKLPLS